MQTTKYVKLSLMTDTKSPVYTFGSDEYQHVIEGDYGVSSETVANIVHNFHKLPHDKKRKLALCIPVNLCIRIMTCVHDFSEFASLCGRPLEFLCEYALEYDHGIFLQRVIDTCSTTPEIFSMFVKEKDDDFIVASLQKCPEYAKNITPDIAFEILSRTAADHPTSLYLLEALDFGTEPQPQTTMLHLLEKMGSRSKAYPFFAKYSTHETRVQIMRMMFQAHPFMFGLHYFAKYFKLAEFLDAEIEYALEGNQHDSVIEFLLKNNRVPPKVCEKLLTPKFVVAAYAKGLLEGMDKRRIARKTWKALKTSKYSPKILVFIIRECSPVKKMTEQSMLYFVRNHLTHVANPLKIAELFVLNGLKMSKILAVLPLKCPHRQALVSVQEKIEAYCARKIQRWWLKICYDTTRDMYKRMTLKVANTLIC